MQNAPGFTFVRQEIAKHLVNLLPSQLTMGIRVGAVPVLLITTNFAETSVEGNAGIGTHNSVCGELLLIF